MSTPAIAKLKYSHEAMIDLIILDPSVEAHELAQLFGYSTAWVNRILVSDSFQSRLAERKGDLIDPTIAATLSNRVATVTVQALDLVSSKLEAEQSALFAVEALGIVAKVQAAQSSHPVVRSSGV